MKTKTVFFCNDCGNETSKWFGRCPACGAWNSLVEEEKVVGKKVSPALASPSPALKPSKLNSIEANEEIRYKTGIGEFDRVLGGGLVRGSLVLLGGDPGIGKSTLLMQVCKKLAQDKQIIYFSGEESAYQLKMRADRLKVSADNLYISPQINLDEIVACIHNIKPEIVIIDSIQTMYSPSITSATGSVSQVREVTMTLMREAKELGISMFIVGHVTKEGGIAGPKVLEHMVDCVLYIEGERHQFYRILRGVKNRFGSTNEIGVFEMSSQGLVEVKNPSLMFLEGRPTNVSGTSVVCTLEGSRPILAEVQALSGKTAFGMPRRSSTGFDFNRIAMLIAVLEKRASINLSAHDIYVNIIGGLKIDEPAADLGVICAIASAFRDFIIPDKTVLIGEVGLTGEIRAVSGIEKRIKEIEKLGFEQCIIPAANMNAIKKSGASFDIEITPVRNVLETLAVLR